MRSQGKHVKKQGSFIGFAAKFLLIVAIMVALFIGGFVLWVFYGEEGDGKADTSEQKTEEEAQVIEDAVIDVSKNWSVPDAAFKGSNGYGKFVSGGVKNKISRKRIFSSMGLEESTKDPAEIKRIEAVKTFLDGLYYEADKTENLSNGDTIKVYIRSTEDPEDIEEEAKVQIDGVGEHKNVTVSGLTEKFSLYELTDRKDLLDALVSEGKKKVRSSEDGHYNEIFGDEEKYDAELTLYSMYFAQPQDKSCDDHIVLVYRVKSRYPDDNYVYWNKEGDWVYTYAACHYEDINKDTTVKDIKGGVKYDMFRYQDKASEIFQWYKDNLDDDTTYYLVQVPYSE